jgi:TRAP-type C4-dicarboxylate transport system permease small subunit
MSNNNITVEMVDKVVVRVIKSISYISGVCLIGIMLVAFFNVIGEKLRALGLPFKGIPSSTEIIQYLHIPVVFLAAAHVTLDRGHTRIDLLSSKFPKTVQNIFDTFGNICGIIICGFISQRGFVQMNKFITRNMKSSVSGVGFPLWPFALILSIGFALLAFSFLWSIVREYAKKDFSLGGNN